MLPFFKFVTTKKHIPIKSYNSISKNILPDTRDLANITQISRAQSYHPFVIKKIGRNLYVVHYHFSHSEYFKFSNTERIISFEIAPDANGIRNYIVISLTEKTTFKRDNVLFNLTEAGLNTAHNINLEEMGHIVDEVSENFNHMYDNLYNQYLKEDQQEKLANFKACIELLYNRSYLAAAYAYQKSQNMPQNRGETHSVVKLTNANSNTTITLRNENLTQLPSYNEYLNVLKQKFNSSTDFTNWSSKILKEKPKEPNFNFKSTGKAIVKTAHGKTVIYPEFE